MLLKPHYIATNCNLFFSAFTSDQHCSTSFWYVILASCYCYNYLNYYLLFLSTEMGTITMRQDAVEELIANERMYFELLALLKQYVDLNRLISQLIKVPKGGNLNQQLHRYQQSISNIVSNFLHQIFFYSMLF
jgi:hypothetical protein